MPPLSGSGMSYKGIEVDLIPDWLAFAPLFQPLLADDFIQNE